MSTYIFGFYKDKYFKIFIKLYFKINIILIMRNIVQNNSYILFNINFIIINEKIYELKINMSSRKNTTRYPVFR